MPRTFLAMVTILLALPGAAGAQNAAMTRPGETVPDHPPWTAIGRVDVRGKAGGGQCTGTLVGARLLLTAAHCVTGRAGRPVQSQRIVVSFVSAALQRKKAYEVSGIALSPTFRLQRDWTMVAGDWALLRLSRSPGLHALALQPAGAVPGTVADDDIVRAGFGGDSRGRLTLHRRCEVHPDGSVPGLLLNRCFSAPGNSGSPLILLRGNEAWLIGLHTAIGPRVWPGSGDVDQVGAGPSLEQFAPAIRAQGIGADPRSSSQQR